MSKKKKPKQPEALAAIPENIIEKTVSSLQDKNEIPIGADANTGAVEDTSKITGTIVQENEKVIAYFKGNNIPYCKKCLRQFRTSFDGLKICSANYSKEECPNLHD